MNWGEILKMELSQAQQKLLEVLKSIKEMDEDLIIATMLAVKEPTKTDRLIDYIIEIWDKNLKLNKDEIVKKALEISQE